MMIGPMPQLVSGPLFRGYIRLILQPVVYAAARRAGYDMRNFIEAVPDEVAYLAEKQAFAEWANGHE